MRASAEPTRSPPFGWEHAGTLPLGAIPSTRRRDRTLDPFLCSTTWQVQRQARRKLLQITVAGVKSPLRRLADGRPDLRVIDGRFMVIEQTMGKSKGRPAA